MLLLHAPCMFPIKETWIIGLILVIGVPRRDFLTIIVITHKLSATLCT